MGRTLRTRRRHAVLAVGLLVFLTGCGPAEEDAYPFAALEGRVLSDAPFLVVPNRAWRSDEAQETWYFGHAASLICRVDAPPAEPLVFRFVPAEVAPDLDLLWDGEDVSKRSRRHPSGELSVEIPAASLSAGTHFLTLRRPDRERDAGDVFHRFRAIGYRYRGEDHLLPARELQTYRYLSSLLSFGLTGSFHSELLGGFVFAGPRAVEVDLGTARGGLLQLEVQNSGAGAADFRVSWKDDAHELRLEPHRRRHLRLDVPPGARTVRLAASGDPNGFFLWGAPHFQPRAAETHAPVVLITLDTTRRDAFAVYGGDPAATPRLDAFAARATVFDHAYTPAPWTLPAHASIFTGLYPSRHGAGVRSDHLEIGFETLAEALRRRGYVTAGFAGGMLSSSHFGVGQGFATYRSAEGFETPADELTAQASGFLAEAIVDGGPRPPFFLFVNYFDPHFPYRAPAAFREIFDVAARRRAMGHDGPWQATLDGSGKAWEDVVDGRAPATVQALAALRAAYLAEVAFMDAQVGELLRRLEDRGLFDDALIVVTADHGELLGEGGYFSHSARLDGELVEIPLIVKWPGQREGRRDEGLVSLVDLFPTILAAAGGRPDGLEVDGLALSPPGGGRKLAERAFVVAEEHDADFHALPPRMRIAADLFAALGRDERQISWDAGGACSRRTAGAWQPVTCDRRRFDAVLRLRRELERDAYLPRAVRIGLSREERQRLQALGYLR